ncbi:class II fructose-1,6-bisphosphate aldolase [Natroniella sulfidigena]|uniref:class II fructose-1,6-bisphosphate aldolase n=1 Tax=Natroniella sulfidigena TaxID=723921 RepID=UPI00200AC474|nr:class II fructose-1,6-bisphosphate aldolase [Natroniella sulfidigena]MCK8816416.1 class II fructose-1,6-bisphosphate aldolase [Natroniella sulfidigena]
MSLVPMSQILEQANQEGYAVGGFNMNNLEFLQAIIEASEEENSPVILQASEGALRYMDMHLALPMAISAAENADIPVAIHLDHGSSFSKIIECIRNGFTSVMIDGSKSPFEENVALTQKVVEAAHAVGVTVEAELGKIGGAEDDHVVKSASLADPDECVEFVERTNVDALAVAFGTAHGVYKGEPELDFELLEEVNNRIPLPIVMHGASGVPEESVTKAIELGVNKINVNTAFQQAWTAKVREVLEDPDVYDPRKICGPGREAMIEAVKEKIRLFGSNDKA